MMFYNQMENASLRTSHDALHADGKHFLKDVI